MEQIENDKLEEWAAIIDACENTVYLCQGEISGKKEYDREGMSNVLFLVGYVLEKIVSDIDSHM